MTKELAKTLTTALVQFIDRERPEGSVCCSSSECEKIEKAFEGGTYDVVENLIKKKLSGLTEFEDKLVSFALQCGGQWDTANEEAKKWSNEFLALAKKELARRDEVITLDNLPPYDKGFQDGKAEAMADLERTFECNPEKLPIWLKNELAKKHLEGYIKGKEDARREYNNMAAFIGGYGSYGSQRPLCWEPGGICINPHFDCINCPKVATGGTITTPNTASGTFTLKAEK